MEFVKLKELIDSQFTVESVGLPKWKKWDPTTNKMLIADKPEKGYSKRYPITTDRGLLDLGSGQLGNCLESVMLNGASNMIGVTYEVKSNGKQGMDIRYFLNPIRVENELDFDESGAPIDGTY